MADEVYDGAIGIDLGKSLSAAAAAVRRLPVAQPNIRDR